MVVLLQWKWAQIRPHYPLHHLVHAEESVTKHKPLRGNKRYKQKLLGYFPITKQTVLLCNYYRKMGAIISYDKRKNNYKTKQHEPVFCIMLVRIINSGDANNRVTWHVPCGSHKWWINMYNRNNPLWKLERKKKKRK